MKKVSERWIVTFSFLTLCFFAVDAATFLPCTNSEAAKLNWSSLVGYEITRSALWVLRPIVTAWPMAWPTLVNVSLNACGCDWQVIWARMLFTTDTSFAELVCGKYCPPVEVATFCSAATLSGDVALSPNPIT